MIRRCQVARVDCGERIWHMQLSMLTIRPAKPITTATVSSAFSQAADMMTGCRCVGQDSTMVPNEMNAAKRLGSKHQSDAKMQYACDISRNQCDSPLGMRPLLRAPRILVRRAGLDRENAERCSAFVDGRMCVRAGSWLTPLSRSSPSCEACPRHARAAQRRGTPSSAWAPQPAAG